MISQPLIGLFTAGRQPLAAVAPLRLRALAAEAALQRVGFALFDAAGVRLEDDTILGWTLGPDGWTESRLPLPGVVINPVNPGTEAEWTIEQALRRRIPFTTARIADKIGIAEVLGGTPVAGNVIPFQPLVADGLTDRIGDFLARHRSAVVKPAKGRRGRDVLFVTLADAGLLVRQQLAERPVTLSAFAEELRPRLLEGPWTIQKFIESRARDGRRFDVRVHVHKDGAGQWSLVRAYIRLSEAGLLVANTSRGGYQGDLDHFFANVRSVAPDLTQRLRALGLQTAEILDGLYGNRLDELGVDLLVDGARHPWIIEVNTHPQSRYHEFERARFVMAYAAHLARCATCDRGEF